MVANGIVTFWFISINDKFYNLLGLWTLKGTISKSKLASKLFFEHIESKSKGSNFKIHVLNFFLWFMWIWCHFNGMNVNPWKLIKSQGEIRFVQEIQSINLLQSWNVIYSWWNKMSILYYSWMNFIWLWDFKKFSWMDFHPMKNGLESTSLIKMDWKTKNQNQNLSNLFNMFKT